MRGSAAEIGRALPSEQYCSSFGGVAARPGVLSGPSPVGGGPSLDKQSSDQAKPRHCWLLQDTAGTKPSAEVFHSQPQGLSGDHQSRRTKSGRKQGTAGEFPVGPACSGTFSAIKLGSCAESWPVTYLGVVKKMGETLSSLPHQKRASSGHLEGSTCLGSLRQPASQSYAPRAGHSRTNLQRGTDCRKRPQSAPRIDTVSDRRYRG